MNHPLRTAAVAATLAVSAALAPVAAYADGGAPSKIKICNSANSTGGDPIWVGYGSGNPWVNPGECKRVANDHGQARITVYSDWKKKVAGYSYGACHNGSRFGTTVNPPNVGKLYVKTLKGNPC